MYLPDSLCSRLLKEYKSTMSRQTQEHAAGLVGHGSEDRYKRFISFLPYGTIVGLES